MVRLDAIPSEPMQNARQFASKPPPSRRPIPLDALVQKR